MVKPKSIRNYGKLTDTSDEERYFDLAIQSLVESGKRPSELVTVTPPRPRSMKSGAAKIRHDPR
jgi:hypothetical protein